MRHQPTASFLCPVVIGRERELEAVQGFLAQKRGPGLLVSGETGIGKSRLAGEAATYAARLGFQVLWGRCYEPDRLSPYAPLIDLLRSLFSARPPQEILGPMGPLASDVVKLLPELAPLSPDSPPAQAIDPDQEKRRLFQAAVQLFTNLASAQPLLVIAEDLHWSDDTSFEFLLHLMRRTASHALLVLMTYRSDEVHPGLDAFLASLDRERLAEELRLEPLTTAQVEAMLRTILHQERPLRAQFLDAMHVLTEGNPFFIEEVLKSLVAAGEIYQAFGRWDWKAVSALQIPRSVAHAVQRRMERLTSAARELAVVASVAGRRFDFSLLRHLMGREEKELIPLLKELVEAQLVGEESAERFAFRHALTREAIYSQLLGRERQALHLAVGEAVERLYGASLETHVGEVAYHFYEAGAWGKALECSRRAGERAQALYAPRAAVEHFSRALGAARQLSAEPSAGLHRARALAYQTLGDFEGANADLEAALEIAREAGEHRGEWEALVELGSLWTGRDYGRAGDFLRRAYTLAQEMDSQPVQARSLNRIGNWHLNVGQAHEALRYHEEALVIFQRANEPRGIAETLDLLGMSSYLSGDLVKGTGYYQQAIEIFRTLDDRPGLASVLATLPLRGLTYNCDTLVSAETDLEACTRDGEAALAAAHQIGWRAGEVYAMFNLAFCLGPQGAYQRAFEFARGALGGAEEIEHRQWMTAAHCVLGSLYLDVLACHDAQMHLEQALHLARETGSSYWIHVATGALASTYVQQRRLDRAASVLNALGSGTTNEAPGVRQSVCASAEFAMARGDLMGALHTVDHLIASAPNMGGGRSVIRLSTLRGRVLVRLDRLEEAEGELEDAKKNALGLGALPMLWRVHLALGTLNGRMKRREWSHIEFSAAQKVVEKLVAKIGDQTLGDTFLRGVAELMPRMASPPGQRTAKERFGGLTPREREVARLIAMGYSNRRLAEDLVVSERTVETHVSNIMSKLTFTSRAQIASWAVEKGLGPTPQ